MIFSSAAVSIRARSSDGSSKEEEALMEMRAFVRDSKSKVLVVGAISRLPSLKICKF